MGSSVYLTVSRKVYVAEIALSSTLKTGKRRGGMKGWMIVLKFVIVDVKFIFVERAVPLSILTESLMSGV